MTDRPNNLLLLFLLYYYSHTCLNIISQFFDFAFLRISLFTAENKSFDHILTDNVCFEVVCCPIKSFAISINTHDKLLTNSLHWCLVEYMLLSLISCCMKFVDIIFSTVCRNYLFLFKETISVFCK